MSSVVTFSPRYQKWYSRPKTTATVVFLGPHDQPNPPEFVDATDIRLFTDPPPPVVGGHGGY